MLLDDDSDEYLLCLRGGKRDWSLPSLLELGLVLIVLCPLEDAPDRLLLRLLRGVT